MKQPISPLISLDRTAIESHAMSLPVQHFIGEFDHPFRRLDVLVPAVVLVTVCPASPTKIHLSADFAAFAEALVLDGEGGHALFLKTRPNAKLHSAMRVNNSDEGFSHVVSSSMAPQVAAGWLERLKTKMSGGKPPKGMLILHITVPKVPDIIQHGSALVLVDGVDQFSLTAQVTGGTLCLKGKVQNLACFATGETTNVLARDLHARDADGVNAADGANIHVTVNERFRGHARDPNSRVFIYGKPPMSSIEMVGGGRVECLDSTSDMGHPESQVSVASV